MTSAAGVDRFKGKAGKSLLIEALQKQAIVRGDVDLATAVANSGELVAVKSDETIITENEAANDMFFVLLGDFRVTVSGTDVARRGPGQHVGEQALIDPTQTRVASVTAVVDSTVVRLTRKKFENIATKHPAVWKYIAQELSVRLAQRNRFVRPRNDQIQVFIICSAEALPVAQEIQASLNSNTVLCTLWTDGVFRAGQYPVEALENALVDKDFAIAVAAPDDFTKTRGQTVIVPRDNVIFELGMFMGVLGRKRAFLLENRDEKIKLPSDLKGLITIPYKKAPADKIRATLAPACQELRRAFDAEGPL